MVKSTQLPPPTLGGTNKFAHGTNMISVFVAPNGSPAEEPSMDCCGELIDNCSEFGFFQPTIESQFTLPLPFFTDIRPFFDLSHLSGWQLFASWLHTPISRASCNFRAIDPALSILVTSCSMWREDRYWKAWRSTPSPPSGSGRPFKPAPWTRDVEVSCCAHCRQPFWS